MKTNSFAIAAPLLLAVFVTGCASLGKMSDTKNVQAVFDERSALKQAYLIQPKGKPLWTPNWRKYVAGIKSISVQPCPKDFQGAWFDYVVALERTHANDP